MLDIYDFNNDVWLCHSFNGMCLNVTSFVSIFVYWYADCDFGSHYWFITSLLDVFYSQQPAVNVLIEIEAFLHENPTEIVTIFFEDYVASPLGLTKVLSASRLDRYLFPLFQMPKNGEDWPTVDEMVKRNQRLVVFTSKSSKEASELIAYEWNYVVENQCEFC